MKQYLFFVTFGITLSLMINAFGTTTQAQESKKNAMQFIIPWQSKTLTRRVPSISENTSINLDQLLAKCMEIASSGPSVDKSMSIDHQKNEHDQQEYKALKKLWSTLFSNIKNAYNTAIGYPLAEDLDDQINELWEKIENDPRNIAAQRLRCLTYTLEGMTIKNERAYQDMKSTVMSLKNHALYQQDQLQKVFDEFIS